MMLLLALLIFPSFHTVSGNFPRDLYGAEDTRPGTWGCADYAVLPIQFDPPEGKRVKILTLRGDLVAWIKSARPERTPEESTAGVLAGFQTTGSLNDLSTGGCNYCDADTPVYIQDAVTERQPKTRAAFNYEHVDMLLDSDNVLNAKIASFLNTTGKPIHVELTYTIQFIWE